MYDNHKTVTKEYVRAIHVTVHSRSSLSIYKHNVQCDTRVQYTSLIFRNIIIISQLKVQ